jgi:hypothetical protein
MLSLLDHRVWRTPDWAEGPLGDQELECARRISQDHLSVEPLFHRELDVGSRIDAMEDGAHVGRRLQEARNERELKDTA